jgi:hypothetical protein
VVSALDDVGLEVPRQGEGYITARDPDGGKRWWLKGELYERDFEPERLDLPSALTRLDSMDLVCGHSGTIDGSEHLQRASGHVDSRQ